MNFPSKEWDCYPLVVVPPRVSPAAREREARKLAAKARSRRRRRPR